MGGRPAEKPRPCLRQGEWGPRPFPVLPAEGKNHTTLNDDLGKPDDKPTRELFEFLGKVLKK